MKKSIFTKTILLFLAVILPLYVITFFVSVKSRQILMDYYSKSVHQQVDSYFSILQTDLSRIEKMRMAFMMDPDVNRLAQFTLEEFDFEAASSVNRTFDDMKIIQMSSNNIASITLHLPRMQRSLTVTSSGQRYSKFNAKEDMPSLTEYTQLGSLFYKDGDLNLIGNSSGINYLQNDTFCLIIRLSTSQLLKTLNQFNVVPQGCSMIYVKGQHELLCLPQHQVFADLLNNSFTHQVPVHDPVYLNGEAFHLIVQPSSLGLTYLQLVPIHQATQDLEQTKLWYIFTVLLAVVAGLLYTTAIYFMVKRPMSILVNSFKNMENGKFDPIIKESQSSEFHYVFLSFNHMALKMQHLIDVVYKQQLLNQKARLRQLQAQINPHFLYNSFYILRNWIKKGRYENAEQFCQMLSLYFNYLNQNYHNYGTLAQEVKHAELYAQIQSIRFAPRIRIEFEELSHCYDNVVVPRLILQPLLENAFKYGLKDVEENGILKVSFEYDPKLIHVIVEDNGCNEDSIDVLLDKIHKLFQNADSVTETSALLNIQQRMRLFSSSDECGLTFARSELGGLKVILTLLIEQEKQDD